MGVGVQSDQTQNPMSNLTVTLGIDEGVIQAHTEEEEKSVNTPAVQMRGEPAKRMIRCNLVPSTG